MPGSIWLNSFTDGLSRGERLVRPDAYAPLTGGANVARGGFHTYAIDVQPGGVTWLLDGNVLERRAQGQAMTWQAWDGPKERAFEAPNKPMHWTFSVVSRRGGARLPSGREGDEKWHGWVGCFAAPQTNTHDQTTQPHNKTPIHQWSHPIEGFGGANQGTTRARFRNLRRVVCDNGATAAATVTATSTPPPASPALLVAPPAASSNVAADAVASGGAAVATAAAAVDGPVRAMNDPILATAAPADGLEAASARNLDAGAALRRAWGQLGLRVLAAVMRAMRGGGASGVAPTTI